MPYAKRTTVPAERSRLQIEDMMRRRGADQFFSGADGKRAILAFRIGGRHMRFMLPLENCASQQQVMARGTPADSAKHGAGRLVSRPTATRRGQVTDIRPDAWFGWTRIEREEWSGQTLVKLTQEGGHVWLTERTFKELSEGLTPWPLAQNIGEDGEHGG